MKELLLLLLLLLKLWKDLAFLTPVFTPRHISLICCTPGQEHGNFTTSRSKYERRSSGAQERQGLHRMWTLNHSIRKENESKKALLLTACRANPSHPWPPVLSIKFYWSTAIYSIAQFSSWDRDTVAHKPESACNQDLHRSFAHPCIALGTIWGASAKAVKEQALDKVANAEVTCLKTEIHLSDITILQLLFKQKVSKKKSYSHLTGTRSSLAQCRQMLKGAGNSEGKGDTDISKTAVGWRLSASHTQPWASLKRSSKLNVLKSNESCVRSKGEFCLLRAKGILLILDYTSSFRCIFNISYMSFYISFIFFFPVTSHSWPAKYSLLLASTNDGHLSLRWGKFMRPIILPVLRT